MQTVRSFLAFAAATQIIKPSVGVVVPPGVAKRMANERLPGVLLQAHPGRDVHFFNDRSTGQLAILDLRFDLKPRMEGAAASLLHGARTAAREPLPHDLYQYAVTRQPAFRDEEDLRRYMAWYGAAAGTERPPAAASEAELLRLRFGVLIGAP